MKFVLGRNEMPQKGQGRGMLDFAGMANLQFAVSLPRLVQTARGILAALIIPLGGAKCDI